MALDLQMSMRRCCCKFIVPERKGKGTLRLLIMDYKGNLHRLKSAELSVTNKTIINRLAVLVKNGFVVYTGQPEIRSYELSKFTRDNEEEIMKAIL